MPNDLYIINVRKAFVPSDLTRNGRGCGVISFCRLSVVAFILSGCALPVPIQAASWAIDGLSYLATNKSIMDHGISTVSGRDCATFRIVTEGSVCRASIPVTLASPINPAVNTVYTEVSEIPPPIHSADDLDSEIQ